MSVPYINVEPRHVVRNKVVLVNICCFVSDPTSYNVAPGA